MAELDVGHHCAVEHCGQLDFLPFVCNGCGKVFCLEHRGKDDHACTEATPGRAAPAGGAAALTSYACHVPACSARELLPVLCPHCSLQVCFRGEAWGCNRRGAARGPECGRDRARAAHEDEAAGSGGAGDPSGGAAVPACAVAATCGGLRGAAAAAAAGGAGGACRVRVSRVVGGTRRRLGRQRHAPSQQQPRRQCQEAASVRRGDAARLAHGRPRGLAAVGPGERGRGCGRRGAQGWRRRSARVPGPRLRCRTGSFATVGDITAVVSSASDLQALADGGGGSRRCCTCDP
ncbi:AN1-type zinc finger protein 1 isoform X2 [Petromyzon marinus]|uniref:AN1-type zinc finger protein 1 isoform X2 n=1 Tax=Petromyzon marinus TaxID=7757 RepID=UPI003F704563